MKFYTSWGLFDLAKRDHYKFKMDQILIEIFIQDLHKRMYGKVWRWAGAYRKTNKNIGVDKLEIPVYLRTLLDDASYWIEHKIYSPEAFAVRFKHRLASIHCFLNGNGRHSRLIADIIIEKIYKLPVFTWSGASLSNETEAKDKYLKAIKKADKGDFELLLKYVRA